MTRRVHPDSRQRQVELADVETDFPSERNPKSVGGARMSLVFARATAPLFDRSPLSIADYEHLLAYGRTAAIVSIAESVDRVADALVGWLDRGNR